MTDRECVELLQWALPRLRLRWAGFRRVRRQVCKRVARRMRELDLAGAAAYRSHLESHAEEWRTLERLCRISISRWYRDTGVFEALETVVLPALAAAAQARGARALFCWSAGCASGEEAYSLKALWEIALRSRHPDLDLALTATDAEAQLIERARRARFGASSVKRLPAAWRDEVLEECDAGCRVRSAFREGIAFRVGDLRGELPEGPFDLVLCRNVAFTYFDDGLQRELAGRLAEVVRPGGALLLGTHETLPAATAGFTRWDVAPGLYRRSDRGRA